MLAVVQTNVKRMLAYSSISHAGFILVGVEAAGYGSGHVRPGRGVPSVVLYLLLYAVLVIGTFAVVTRRRSRGDGGDTTSTPSPGSPSVGRCWRSAFTVLLLAQAGVPLTIGFVAKFGVIQAAVEARATPSPSSPWSAPSSPPSCTCGSWSPCGSPTRAGDASDGDAAGGKVAVPFSMGVVITLSVAFTLVLGVLPGWLIDAADQVTQYAR